MFRIIMLLVQVLVVFWSICLTGAAQEWQFIARVGRINLKLAIHPSDPQKMLVIASDGMYRSLDAGNEWEKIFPFALKDSVQLLDMGFNPANPAIIWLIAEFKDDTTYNYLYDSDDFGLTWRNRLQWQMVAIPGSFISFSSRKADIVYRFNFHGVNMELSTNGGATWRPIGNNLPEGGIWGILEDPYQEDRLLVSAYDGLYFSVDGGETFLLRNTQMAQTQNLWWDPWFPGFIYFCNATGLFRAPEEVIFPETIRWDVTTDNLGDLVFVLNRPGMVILRNKEENAVHFSLNGGERLQLLDSKGLTGGFADVDVAQSLYWIYGLNVYDGLFRMNYMLGINNGYVRLNLRPAILTEWFQLGSTSFDKMQIYDLKGRPVNTDYRGILNNYAGVYFIRESQNSSEKVIKVK